PLLGAVEALATPEAPQPEARDGDDGANPKSVRHAGGDNMVSRGSQVALVGVLVALVGGESPARGKPWRHAPDPTAAAAPAPASPALAALPGDPDVHGARSHTLRVHVDAAPGRLTAIVSPSMWARRITLGTVFEPLLRYVPPEGSNPGRFAPRLARSWRVMPN